MVYIWFMASQVKANEVGGACALMGEERKVYQRKETTGKTKV
jgi:hypothetical protein